MTLFSVGNMVAWGISAVICAYVSKEKSKDSTLALIMGLLFGFFSMLYYLFSQSKNNKWKTKKSWYILVGYILLIIIISIIESLIGI